MQVSHEKNSSNCHLCSLPITIPSANLLATQRGIKVSAKTQDGKTIPLYSESYALVIGNGNYVNGWDPLPGAIRDVKDVARALEENGFNVILKTDLTKAEFTKIFGNFCYQYGRGKNNRLLFYYAGHGHTQKMFTNEDLGYLVMVDAPVPEKDPMGFRFSSVDMQAIVTEAKMIKSRHVLFMFDSCFSGSILNLRERVVPESISDSVSLPVRQFITAGRANEPVPDHSIFKQAFLDLLEGRDKEPIPDGYITGEELGLYLKNKVPEYNPMQHPQYGKIKDIRLDKGDFVFVLKMPSKHQPPAVGQSSSIRDYDKIIEEREVNKKKWDLWQRGMEDDFAKVEGYDQSSALSAKEKAEVWEGLLASYSTDNPYTVEDNIFRIKAVERNRHWKAPRESGNLFVDTVPSNATIRILNIKPKFYQGIELDPGKYHVEVSASGYKTKKKWVELSAGEDENINIRLDAVVSQQTAVSGQSGRNLTNSLGMEFVFIKPGSFMMGSALSPSEVVSRYGGKEKYYKREHPQHRVTLTKGFYMQTTEVTVGQWREFVRASGYKSDAETGGGAYVWGGEKWEKKAGAYWDNPGFSQTDSNPVTCISWNDAQAFAKWLSREVGGDYRLPTEAEWEYAARAGTKTPFYTGDCLSTGEANYNGNYPGNSCSKGEFRKRPTPVGTFSPNRWGLYDMHGNVWEWCQDWYGGYPSGSVTDPKGASSGSYRVVRGGCWSSIARFCRSASRYRDAPGFSYGLLGFRLARAQ